MPPTLKNNYPHSLIPKISSHKSSPTPPIVRLRRRNWTARRLQPHKIVHAPRIEIIHRDVVA